MIAMEQVDTIRDTQRKKNKWVGSTEVFKRKVNYLQTGADIQWGCMPYFVPESSSNSFVYASSEGSIVTVRYCILV